MAIARRTPYGPAEFAPATIGPYSVERKLVDAGTGPVFLARNDLEHPVLVKAITAAFGRDADFRRRLEEDLERLREIDPFCVATILDVDTTTQPPYVAVEFVNAPTLAASVEDEGPLSAADTGRLALGLAAALTALHEHDIVFADLKPTNVVLSGQGIRLVDFGLARVLNAGSADNSGASSSGIGTLAFISPEQVLGRAVTVASDVFTWGGVLLFAATGRPPFGGGNRRALLQRAVYAEPDLSALEPDLRELVAAAMRKDPKRRPEAAELLELLIEESPEAGSHHPPAGADHGVTRDLLPVLATISTPVIPAPPIADRADPDEPGAEDRRLGDDEADGPDVDDADADPPNEATPDEPDADAEAVVAAEVEDDAPEAGMAGASGAAPTAGAVPPQGGPAQGGPARGEPEPVLVLVQRALGEARSDSSEARSAEIRADRSVTATALARALTATETPGRQAVSAAPAPATPGVPGAASVASPSATQDEGAPGSPGVAAATGGLDPLERMPSRPVRAARRGWLWRVLSLGAASSVLATVGVVSVLDGVRDRAGGRVSRRAAGSALRLLDGRPDLARQVAVAAYRTSPTQSAARALVEASARQISASAGAVQGIALSADGRYLVVVGDSGAAVWDIADPAGAHQVADLSAQAPPPVDRRRLAAGGHRASKGVSAARAVVILARPQASSVAAPAPRTIVTADADGTVRLWRLDPPRILADAGLDRIRTSPAQVTALAEIRGHAGAVTALAAGGAGRTLASAGADGTIRLWDVSDPQAPRARGVLRVPFPATTLAYTPDGRSLVGGGPGWLAVWDVSDPGAPRLRADRLANPAGAGAGGDPAVVRGLAVSPDGRWFVATSTSGGRAGAEVYLLDDPRGLRRLSSISGVAAATASALALSADGGVLALGDQPGELGLWDMSRPSNPVRRAAVPAADGTGAGVFGQAGPAAGMLAVAAGGEVRLWQLDLRAAQAAACARAGDPITRAQWHAYLGRRPYHPPC